VYHNYMKHKHFIWWITIVGLIGIGFGIFYSIFGLGALPVYQKFVPKESLEGWSRGLYGAVFIGFSVLLLLLGRRAIQRKDKELGKILLYGIAAWIVYEALMSLIYGVYINVLIDMALLAFLSYPLLKGIPK
jgi:uncharacterized membrane protein YidH (DUF202 family)